MSRRSKCPGVPDLVIGAFLEAMSTSFLSSKGVAFSNEPWSCWENMEEACLNSRCGGGR